jgi:ankyrin repeat protein
MPPRYNSFLTQQPSLTNIRSEAGETPLYLACSWGHTESALALLRHGGDPNVARLADGAAPLHALAGGSARLEILDALLAAGASPDARDNSGRTAVQIAALRSIPVEEAEADTFRFAEHLLDQGKVQIDCWTAAALNRPAPIANLTGAVNARNADGDTPLHTAARAGHRPIIKALLDAGSEIRGC